MTAARTAGAAAVCKEERSQCGIDRATYDLLTRQCTKNPELCSERCGDEFGLEFYWNGALNPVLWFCGGIRALACFKCLFIASSRSDFYRTEYVVFTLLTRGNSESAKSLKRFQIALKRKMTIEKTTRH